jgi:hypothetical protein
MLQVADGLTLVLVDLSSRKFIEANPAATVLTGTQGTPPDMRPWNIRRKAEDYSG